MATVQPAVAVVPVHASDHPMNLDPPDGEALSTTFVPGAKPAAQVVMSAAHDIPAGSEETAPGPAFRTVSTHVNSASTVFDASIVTLHVVPLTLVHPDQLVKLLPVVGVALSWIIWPSL